MQLNASRNTTRKSTRSKRTNQTYNLPAEQHLQLMKISLKKQSDRKQKLEKLYQRYKLINQEEQAHIRLIKSFIIELKDTVDIMKQKFMIDPTIYVNNELSTQIRAYLCTLLNTFSNNYIQSKSYEQDAKYSTKIIENLLKDIITQQEKLFIAEKESISEQVQLQGDFLKQKCKLRDEINKIKDLTEENAKVMEIQADVRSKYLSKLQLIQGLKKDIAKTQQDTEILHKQIQLSKAIQDENKIKLTDELVYRCKFTEEKQKVESQIKKQQIKQQKLMRQIKNKKIKVLQAKNILANEARIKEIQLGLLKRPKNIPF